MVELAAVGLSLTPEELETHSKQCLVSSLLQSQGTSPMVGPQLSEVYGAVFDTGTEAGS